MCSATFQWSATCGGSGINDPVMTPDLTNGYADRISDFEVELVDGVGHWIVHQRPQLVLDRVRAFLNAET